MDTPKTLSRDEAIGLVRRYKRAIAHRFPQEPKVMMFGSYAKALQIHGVTLMWLSLYRK